MDLSKLLRLRKVTRAVEEHFRNQLDAHLLSLQPLFKPANILGEYVRNAPQQSLKVADASFKELRSLYARIGRVKPFRFEDEIRSPIDVFGNAVEITPVTYEYAPQNAENGPKIKVTSPLKWVLSYKGLGPSQLRALLVSRSGTARVELQSCLVHNLVLHIILSQRPGVVPILRAMRFEVSTRFEEALGGLPIAYVAAPVKTMLPDDEIITQSSELSGSSAFEEIIDIESVLGMADPLQDALIDLVRGFGDELLDRGSETGDS
jgi:hypothetical protein